MLQTSVFNSFAYPSRSGVVKLLALGTFFGGAYGCYWHQIRSSQRQQLYTKVQSDITEWKPQTISGVDARYYPWAPAGALRKWEYQLVKVYGFFRDERFFVRREREGRDGYLVFAPFVTALFNPDHQKDPENVTKTQVMVNLGWVPLENINDIQMGQDPIGTTTFDLTESEVLDGWTEFSRDPKLLDEDLQMPFVEFTGIVRRGESENWLRGRRNWPDAGVYNWIDLGFMSRFFRSFNLEASSTAYIERIVPEYDEESENLYPIPATKDNFDKPLPSPQTHQTYSLFYGLSSVVSLALLALRR